ncbi:predicted protein [Uncinocarpus reesii 1704]|uniref:methylated diphthine methylhydrolase n=1 Tax=Uncinocarpus reesii (strain UAMH 1704) TaxID=336963 RepID=C4JZK2_UNCRE|nr:uncharacterized protein UREG_07603 [Uncinocarpus reesii 1704]EEP82738.1 predicted protein [Uncinocarpus reesii 1704]
MDISVQTPSSLFTLFLDQPPSCLEFCPTAPDHLLISTYLLNEVPEEGSPAPTQVRTGSLQLFKLDTHSCQLSPVQSLPLDSAVFDFQFSPRDPSLFAVALSKSVVSLYRIEISNDELNLSARIVFVRSINIHEDAAQLALCLAWIPTGSRQQNKEDTPDIKDGFAVSFSDGRVSVFYTKSDIGTHDDAKLSEIQLGGFPIESTGDEQLPVLFAGNDMHHIRGATLTEMDCTDDVSSRSWQLDDRGRHHDAGVTAILPLFADETGIIILTGSYDENIRVYHFKGRAEVLASKNLGGGVWRLRLIQIEDSQATDIRSRHYQSDLDLRRSYLILASCMHGGARLLRVSYFASRGNSQDGEGKWEINLLAEFKEHQSMNYASDFYRGGQKGDGPENSAEECPVLCVTSSFYDKRVCVWKANI